MKRRLIVIALTGVGVFAAAPAHADVVWPALYVITRMATWWSVGLGLAVEYVFVRQLTSFGVVKSMVADLSMNAASCLLGLVVIPLLGVGWEFFPGIVLYRLFHIGTFNPATWTVTFLIAVFVNALLENFVLEKGFKKCLGWKGFWWLSVANAASVGIAFASLWVMPVDS